MESWREPCLRCALHVAVIEERRNHREQATMRVAVAASLLVATVAARSLSPAATPHTVSVPRGAVLDDRQLLPLLRLRGGVHTLTDMDDWAAAQETAGDKLIVLDFTATWCGPCQRIAPAFEAMASEMPDVLFLKCDVDELGELAAELGVTSMPTFLLFRAGENIGSLRGADEQVKLARRRNTCREEAAQIKQTPSLLPCRPCAHSSWSTPRCQREQCLCENRTGSPATLDEAT